MTPSQTLTATPLATPPWVTSFRRLASVDEITVHVYGKKTDRAPVPLIVYFHGGLFNCGSVQDAQAIAQALAATAVIVCVEYPLAPKLHFPATVEVAFEAVQWAWSHAAELGANPARVLVAGDQAGGNLAAVVAMMARDRGAPAGSNGRLKGQILINPMLDPQQTSDSMRAADDCPCRKAWADYLPCASDTMHPYAAPALSRRLGGLAPALIISPELDPLRDEAEQYAGKLIAAGVPVQVRRLEGARGGLVRSDHPGFELVAQMVDQFVADTA